MPAPIPFAAMPATDQARAVDDMARRLVQQDVCYCVSGLIAALRDGMYEYAGSPMNEDDASTLSYRVPDADDFADADTANTAVYEEGGRWHWRDGGDVMPEAFATAVDAWQAAFDARGEEYPEGSEIYEHWLVTDDLARRLKAQGESVVDDLAGLTVWGRATTGQTIYADAVLQRIARDILEA